MYNDETAPLMRFYRPSPSNNNNKLPQWGFKPRRLLSAVETQQGAKRKETAEEKRLDGKSKKKNRETLSLQTRFSEAEEKPSVRCEVGFRCVQGKERRTRGVRRRVHPNAHRSRVACEPWQQTSTSGGRRLLPTTSDHVSFFTGSTLLVPKTVNETIGDLFQRKIMFDVRNSQKLLLMGKTNTEAIAQVSV